MSDSKEARGRCPVCGRRISPLQAAWYGAAKPFACRRCGSRLEKTSSRYFIAAPLIVVSLYVFRSAGIYDPVPWLVFFAGCILVTLDALFLGWVRHVGAAPNERA